MVCQRTLSPNRGLDRAAGREIWDQAAANACVIVGGDEDLFHLLGTDPNGLAFVWVRLGGWRLAASFAVFDRIEVLGRSRNSPVFRVYFHHEQDYRSPIPRPNP